MEKGSMPDLGPFWNRTSLQVRPLFLKDLYAGVCMDPVSPPGWPCLTLLLSHQGHLEQGQTVFDTLPPQ